MWRGKVSNIVGLTCIECPTGCAITVAVENGKVMSVDGFGCRRGRDYAIAEIECPVRILTTTVVAEGLALRMIPVRTSGPIPRERLMDAMSEIRRARVRRPVRVGDVVLADVLGLGVDVISTREVQ
jgi:CxxC motif-containing protein